MKEETLKVIGIGDNVVDDYIDIRKMFPGGNALNFSVFAKMLGCESAYLGVFGSDAKAAHVRRTVIELNIDISRCRIADGPNGHAMLKIEKGERVFISSNRGGVSKSIPMEFIFEDLNYLKSFSVIHTGKYSYMDACLSRLKELNALISYDFSDELEDEQILGLCQFIDIGFLSCAAWNEEATKKLLEKMVKAGCEISVATRGPHDVILFDGKSWHKQPPVQIKPKDTLGAGDAFITGFLISYIGGKYEGRSTKTAIIEDSLKKAVLFASEVCQEQGAFGHGLKY